MPNAGDTIFTPSPFVRWALSPFVLIFVVAMPFLIPKWTWAAALTIGLVELAGLALLAGFWLPPRFSRVGFQVVAALVFSLYVAYLIQQIFVLATSNDPVGVLFNRVSSPLRAMTGMSMIGLPCLWYLIHGRFTRGDEASS